MAKVHVVFKVCYNNSLLFGTLVNQITTHVLWDVGVLYCIGVKMGFRLRYQLLYLVLTLTLVTWAGRKRKCILWW